MKPVIPAAVDHGEHARYEAGLWRAELNETLIPGDIQRIKDGYVCPNCKEVQPKAFPGVCKQLNLGDGQRGCGFNITPKEVSRWFDENYGGEKWIGPSMSQADEDELFREKRARARKENLKKSGVWFPDE